MVRYCSIVDNGSVVNEAVGFVVSATHVERVVIVVALGIVTVSKKVAILLQDDLRLLSEYLTKGIEMAETIHLDGTTTGVGLAVGNVANLVMVNSSICI